MRFLQQTFKMAAKICYNMNHLFANFDYAESANSFSMIEKNGNNVRVKHSQIKEKSQFQLSQNGLVSLSNFKDPFLLRKKTIKTSKVDGWIKNGVLPYLIYRV